MIKPNFEFIWDLWISFYNTITGFVWIVYQDIGDLAELALLELFGVQMDIAINISIMDLLTTPLFYALIALGVCAVVFRLAKEFISL